LWPPVAQSTAALPFGTIVVILVIWSLVTIPLTVFGGIAGKNARGEFSAPVRTNKYPREIPGLPWYRGPVPQMVMAGASRCLETQPWTRRLAATCCSDCI